MNGNRSSMEVISMTQSLEEPVQANRVQPISYVDYRGNKIASIENPRFNEIPTVSSQVKSKRNFNRPNKTVNDDNSSHVITYIKPNSKFIQSIPKPGSSETTTRQEVSNF